MRDPLESDDLFRRQQAEDRRRQVADRLAQNESRRASEEEKRQEVEARTMEFQAKANQRILAAEYAEAEVEPVNVDVDGFPTCSLSMLKNLGWRIVTLGDDKHLIAPYVSEIEE